MKFKKWTITNIDGIPQMKIWAIKPPVKKEVNSNFCNFDKEVSMYRFIVPNIINLSKDLYKNLQIAVAIYVCALAFCGLEGLILNSDKILRVNASEVIVSCFTIVWYIEMFHLIKNRILETSSVRQIFYVLTLTVLLFYFRQSLNSKPISIDLLNSIFVITMLVETVSSMILFIYEVIRIILAYKSCNYIVINEENRTNYHIVKNKEVEKNEN